MTTFLEVETADFVDAAHSMYDLVAEPVRAAVLSLSAGLDGCGAMAGSDPGGLAWAASYDRAAHAALQAGQDVGNACYRLAAMFAQSARNYAAADAASSAHSRAGLEAHLPYDTSFGIGVSPPSAAGGSGDPPAAWGLIPHLLGYVWPDGHQDRLHAAAEAWDRAATALDGHAFDAALAAIGFARDRLPEADDMITVCQGMNGHLESLGGVYRSLAAACRELAHHIDAVHAEVESELWGLTWQTGAIEGVGFVAGLFTFGLAEIPAQVVEGLRVTAIGLRVAELLRTFTAAVRTLAQTVAALVERAGLVTSRMRAILSAQLAVASVSAARRFPELKRIVAERSAILRLSNDVGQVALVKFGAKLRQLEKKFRHASDFGVTAQRGRTGFDAFELAMRDFIRSPETRHVNGVYRGERALLNVDTARRLLVVQRPNGDFWTCFRMTTGQQTTLLKTGRIGVE